jgi:uncharacterized membrane protein YgcG
MKPRIFILSMLLSALLPAMANRGGFHYTHVDVKAVVHVDNTWDVQETFDIFFDEPRHGFYRYIPRTFTLWHDVSDELQTDREELREFEYECDIDRIKVADWDYTTEDGDDAFVILRIGDEDREVRGHQRYVISYRYGYPDDRRPQFDYLYHTILGTDFEQPIDSFSFRVEFDKPLPHSIADDLKVYAGEYGNQSGMMNNLTVDATPTVISGTASEVAPRQGVTLYALLPADYYEGTRTVNYFWHRLFLALSIACVLAIVVMMLRTKHKHVTKVIEFYPPEDVCCAEVGYIIDTKVDSVDIASLIPWLAEKGYISIEEVQKGKIFKSTDLKLTRLKDLPRHAPKYQHQLMKLLFGNGHTVKLNSLGEHPEAMERLKKALTKEFTGKRTLTQQSWAVWLYHLLAVVGTLALATNTVVCTWSFEHFLYAGILYFFPFACFYLWRLAASPGDIVAKWWWRMLGFVGRLLVWGVVGVLYYICVNAYGMPLSWQAIAAIYVVSIALAELIGHFNVNTDYRTQMMGRLLGFREFIKTAEKPRLEQLQTDDPQYFYRILPYAMVFGLSNKWADLFRDVEMERPSWYISARPLMGYDFTRSMTSSLFTASNSAITTISHSSSSSSGGSFSGGGFSGGGGGGGGGGSW